MIQSKILCDICGQEVEHVTKLDLVMFAASKRYTINCLCEGCVDAINSALECRQHLAGTKVEPYEKGMQEPHHIDAKGNKIPHTQTR